MMKLKNHGKSTLEVEVSNISKQGIWIFVIEKEYFLPYSEYPWFKSAKINDIFDVKLLHESHLYWEKIDVDLDISSLDYPEKYPLIYKQ